MAKVLAKVFDRVYERVAGLDVHKAQITVAIVNGQQQILLKPCKIASRHFQQWAESHLTATDQVVLEATNDAWLLVDFLQGGPASRNAGRGSGVVGSLEVLAAVGAQRPVGLDIIHR